MCALPPFSCKTVLVCLVITMWFLSGKVMRSKTNQLKRERKDCESSTQHYSVAQQADCGVKPANKASAALNTASLQYNGCEAQQPQVANKMCIMHYMTTQSASSQTWSFSKEEAIYSPLRTTGLCNDISKSIN